MSVQERVAMADDLYWDSAYALARRLMERYPQARLDCVTLNMIYNWVVALPEFKDDPQLANDELLQAIYQEWYEEINPL
jgi:FeS assembly protein IscX